MRTHCFLSVGIALLVFLIAGIGCSKKKDALVALNERTKTAEEENKTFSTPKIVEQKEESQLVRDSTGIEHAYQFAFSGTLLHVWIEVA